MERLGSEASSLPLETHHRSMGWTERESEGREGAEEGLVPCASRKVSVHGK